jgi:hypothetical protein
MSEPARIVGVYMEPTRTFADIAARPGGWWIPMILIMITSVAFVSCYSQRVGWERMMRHEFETNTRMQNIPPEQREAAMQQAVKFASISGYIGPVLAVPIGFVVVAGVLMLMMTSVMGGQINFKQSLAVVAYASLTGVVSGILSIVVLYLKNPDDFDIRNPLAFNGGAFLGSEAPKWLSSLASSFDVFTFWTMALMAVGYAAASPRKLTWGKAFTGIVIMWVLVVVIKVGWNTVMG